MDISIMNLLNSPVFQQLITLFIAPLAVNSISDRLKAFKAAIKDKTHEEQLLDCLEKAFFETEHALHRKHNTEAIYETFMGSLMSFSSTFNKDSLAKIFKDAIGEDVTDDEISLWIDNLYKQISLPEHEVLYRYLILKKILVVPKSRQQENLEYLLTYTTPVWYNRDVICRDDIIKELFAKLSQGTRRIQVAGMGGLGKTEILVKFFFQLNQPNPPVQFDYIGFIRFNDDLESDFRSQVPYLADYARKNGEEAAKLFLQQLCATNRVLFCIDDNRDKKEIFKNNDPSFVFLKTLNASILFASRTEYADFEQQDLPPLSTEACIEVFQSMCGQKIRSQKDIDILTNIIEDLSGNNTLIVNRLGTIAKEHNYTIAELQEDLAEKKFHIKKDSIEEEELQHEISKLYPLSDLANQAERSILEAFSIFPASPLAADLCVDWLHEDAGVNEEDCSLELTKLSKQRWLDKRTNLSDGVILFSMHQCVKSAVKDQATVIYSAHQKLVDGCRISLNRFTNDYQLQKSSTVIPFAILIYSILFHENAQFIYLSSAIAKFYEKSADYPLALDWYLKDFAIADKVLGQDHPDTATTCNNIACVYYFQSKYDLALQWNLKALDTRLKVFGEEHPDTANTYNNIALIFKSMGQFDYALEGYQRANSIVQKVLGEDHPYTASTYNNIAGIYDIQGQYDLALEWYLKALVIREKVLGKNHPDTAISYNNIAGIYNIQGNSEKALDWYQKALSITLEVLGKDHPDTATIYSNIAGVYEEQGQHHLALEYDQKTISIREKVLGIDHPDTAVAYNNIAIVYQNQREFGLALEWYIKALVIQEKLLGKDHPDTATFYNNIASIYDNQGKYDLAIEWYLKSLTICEKVFGKDHPDTITTYNNIAMIYINQGQYDLAHEWLQKALTNVNKALGEDHPYTIIIKDNIAYLKNMRSS